MGASSLPLSGIHRQLEECLGLATSTYIFCEPLVSVGMGTSAGSTMVLLQEWTTRTPLETSRKSLKLEN